MGFIIVLAIAVAVGVIVFRLTGGGVPVDAPASFEPDDVGQWVGEAAAPEASSASAGPTGGLTTIQVAPDTEIPVVTARRSWHSRLSGALGLVVAIGVGAVALAFTLYTVVNMIGRMFSSAAT